MSDNERVHNHSPNTFCREVECGATKDEPWHLAPANAPRCGRCAELLAAAERFWASP